MESPLAVDTWRIVLDYLVTDNVKMAAVLAPVCRLWKDILADNETLQSKFAILRTKTAWNPEHGHVETAKLVLTSKRLAAAAANHLDLVHILGTGEDANAMARIAGRRGYQRMVVAICDHVSDTWQEALPEAVKHDQMAIVQMAEERRHIIPCRIWADCMHIVITSNKLNMFEAVVRHFTGDLHITRPLEMEEQMVSFWIQSVNLKHLEIAERIEALVIFSWQRASLKAFTHCSLDGMRRANDAGYPPKISWTQFPGIVTEDAIRLLHELVDGERPLKRARV